MTPDWRTLEFQRLLSGAQVYRPLFGTAVRPCDHCGSTKLPITDLPSINLCADCRVPINRESMRCHPCSNKSRRWLGGLV